MKRIHVKDALLLTLFVSLAVVTAPIFAEENPQMTGLSESEQAVESAVQSETTAQTDERRNKIIQEAVDALDQTRNALTALEEDRVDEALEALAVAVGKLELIVARQPELALAPTGVRTTTFDLYGEPEAIRMAIKEAERALEDGEIQVARRLLGGLASEIVITVTNVPLATYPDAIKEIVPLIEDGQIDEAKQALRLALNTLVMTEHVVPLPILRSEEHLKIAEEMAENTDRDDSEEKELSDHLSAVRSQLQMAELLGYADKNDYKNLYTQLDQLEARIADNKTGNAIFDKISMSISNLFD